jgi:uncharacterized protein
MALGRVVQSADSGTTDAFGGSGTPGRPPPGQASPGQPPPGQSPPGERPPGRHPSSTSEWSPWLAPLALAGGLVLAAVGGLLVDIPALVFGVDVNASKLPPGLVIADTAVQDAAFVAVAVFLAQMGGRALRASLFGLRPARMPRALWLTVLALATATAFSIAWTTAFHAKPEKLLDQLGAKDSTLLMLLSATLTCVIAPIGEEFLFRGFIFTTLRNWRGTALAAVLTGLLFGAVHAGSAPAIDLVPLAVLGMVLCLLYRATGSLYPCIAAHAFNNSFAFGELVGWSWQTPVLMVCALSTLAALAIVLTRAGVASRVPATPN